MTAPARLDPLLTEEQAAGILGVSDRTLRKERQAGRLPYIMIRGTIRYSPADLHDYIEKARQCRSTEGRAPRIGNTRSRSAVFDFEEARAARASAKHS